MEGPFGCTITGVGACGASATGGAKASLGAVRGAASEVGVIRAWAVFDIFSLKLELNGSVRLAFTTNSRYGKTKPFGATKILHCKN
jgi:hypothetical protein